MKTLCKLGRLLFGRPRQTGLIYQGGSNILSFSEADTDQYLRMIRKTGMRTANVVCWPPADEAAAARIRRAGMDVVLEPAFGLNDRPGRSNAGVVKVERVPAGERRQFLADHAELFHTSAPSYYRDDLSTGAWMNLACPWLHGQAYVRALDNLADVAGRIRPAVMLLDTEMFRPAFRVERSHPGILESCERCGGPTRYETGRQELTEDIYATIKNASPRSRVLDFGGHWLPDGQHYDGPAVPCYYHRPNHVQLILQQNQNYPMAGGYIILTPWPTAARVNFWTVAEFTLMCKVARENCGARGFILWPGPPFAGRGNAALKAIDPHGEKTCELLAAGMAVWRPRPLPPPR